MRRPIVTYLRMAKLSAQRTRRTNAFATARGDKTAMRPLAELRLTFRFNFKNKFLMYLVLVYRPFSAQIWLYQGWTAIPTQ